MVFADLGVPKGLVPLLFPLGAELFDSGNFQSIEIVVLHFDAVVLSVALGWAALQLSGMSLSGRSIVGSLRLDDPVLGRAHAVEQRALALERLVHRGAVVFDGKWRSVHLLLWIRLARSGLATQELADLQRLQGDR